MDIAVPFEIRDQLHTLLLRAGYHHHRNFSDGQDSYVRRLGRDFYPRLHVYINEQQGTWRLSLHLDQKKPSYPGAHAHSGEYDGPVVSAETQRLNGLISNARHNQSAAGSAGPDVKTNWFAKLLGRP